MRSRTVAVSRSAAGVALGGVNAAGVVGATGRVRAACPGCSNSNSITNSATIARRSLSSAAAPPSRSAGRATHADIIRTFASSSSSPPTDSADITIVGGGVAGLALTCALTAPGSPLSSLHKPPSLALVDAGNLDRLSDWPAPAPSSSAASGSTSSHQDGTAWENRTVSLAADNLAWLLSDSLGVAQHLRRERMWDVNAMCVSDGLTGATIDFGSDDGFDVAANQRLSCMVELSNLQQALLRTLRQREAEGVARIQILQLTKVQDIVPSPPLSADENNPDPWPLLTLAHAKDSAVPAQQLRTRLLIGADGHGSPVRHYAGIRTFGHDYNQRGLVGTLRCAPHSVAHTAFQRFLPTGPIAFLPMSSSAASMVWTLPPDLARALETIHREVSPELLASLINAAYRLPWQSIDYLFTRIRAFLSAAPASTGGTDARDWSWLQDAIDSRVRATLYRSAAEVEALGGVPDEEYSASVGAGSAGGSGSASRPPPKVLTVDARSVASFPLMLRHAEAYTGASLRGPSDSANVSALDAFKPSHVLEGLMGAVGLMRGVARPGGGTQDLTHPEADGHAAPPARSRTVLVGDAAHTVHPLAGQGLNQGLLDVRALARALERAVWEEGADLGLAKTLGSGGYERQRWAANALWASGIDKLGALFSVGDAGRGFGAKDEIGAPGSETESEPGPFRLGRGLMERVLVWGRSTGIDVLNELDPLKERMIRGAGSPSSSSSSSHRQ